MNSQNIPTPQVRSPFSLFTPTQEPTNTGYKCLEKDYIDCMSVVGDGVKFECTNNILTGQSKTVQILKEQPIRV